MPALASFENYAAREGPSAEVSSIEAIMCHLQNHDGLLSSVGQDDTCSGG